MALRLFTGLDVPYEMRRNLELLLQLLKPAADIQWSPLDNLHVTTKFIGDWPEDRLDELKQSLASTPRPGDLNIAIRGLGWFPNPHSPRVFFVGLQAAAGLAALARDTEAACEAVGIPREDREFKPHLTLARIKRPTDLRKLQQTIAALPSIDFGAFTATQFHLYKSELRPGGSVYTKLESYSLTEA
jgi:RNA 2',3'-cyclic 3'-phosphodiesterase